MQNLKKRILGLLLGALLVVPVFADDTEIYVGSVSTVKPNILLIIDTSFSMDTSDATDDHKTFNPSDSLSTYTSVTTSGCLDTKIFYTVGVGAADPTCDSPNYITTTNQYCAKLATAMSTASPAGRWTGKAAQYNTTTKTWSDLLPNGTSGQIECMADRGVHGKTTSAPLYARNNNTSAWGDASTEIAWAQRTTYTFYSARWVKWNSQTPGSYTMSRIEAVKNAVYDMVSSIDDVNMGVMRFNKTSGKSGDPEYQGGVVVSAMKDVSANRNDIIDKVKGFSTNSATPLSETMYEAGRYWAGLTPVWGDNGDMDSAAKSGSNYVSPITESCQRNFNILLTDGRPTWDNQNDTDIETLYKGTCTGQPGDTSIAFAPATGSPASRANAGRCLDEMTNYLSRDSTDLIPTGMDGSQRVKTFTIGFGGNDPSAFDFLSEVATDGGGTRYLANNVSGLGKALTAITTEISNVSSTFATASIGVNSFNRAATRDDLYFAVFNSDDHLRWDGNLKKYKLVAIKDPKTGNKKLIIGDTSGNDAVDTDGFFKAGTQSYWSGSADGNKVTEGGAASKLPATRAVKTHIGAVSTGTLIAIDDSTVTDAKLGTSAVSPTRTEVLNFAKSSNKRLGDPLHSQPVVVTYSGTATTPVDVVYMTTNDGFLHAVDADTGIEKWAFIPEELLPRLKQLSLDPAATTRTYGLDGDVKVVKLDFNGDGDVDSGDGDVVWLFFGMRRGGSYYYAMDVTNKDTPKLMWKDGPTELPGIGETWSPPSVARVEVSGATQNNQKLVLVFGGGYDPDQENGPQLSDNVGNGIYMVDAKSGKLLWQAGPSGVDTNIPGMTNSIPGRVTVLDINGDGYADRMYAADLGGRIFRFDIFSGSAPSGLVTGAVFAKLGNGLAAGGNESSPNDANTRRFYSAPDVALIQRRGADPYYNIAIGSGYRGHPLDRTAVDRFYSLRDKQPFAKLKSPSLTPIIDDPSYKKLIDITSDPVNAVVDTSADGWKLLFDPTDSGTGEKVLNEATTVNGVLLFSTYSPQSASTSEPCRPTSINRVYALRADNGHPALDLNNDGKVDNNDLYESVVHQGILGGVNVGVLRGTLADQMGGGTPTVCLAGMHILGRCVDVSDSVRTYWRKDVDQ